MMDDLIRNFASPLSFKSGDNHDLLAAAYFKGILKRLRKQIDVQSAQPDAAALFDAHIPALSAQIPLGARCWQPELGAVLQRVEERNHTAAVVQALLTLHFLQLPADWSASFPEPVRLSFGGNFFDVAGAIRVTASETVLTISGESRADALVFHHSGGRWTRQQAFNAAEWNLTMPTLLSNAPLPDIYVHGWAEPGNGADDVVVEWPIALREPNSELVAVAAQSIAAALAILERADPLYLNWVGTLFRGVAATPLGYDDMRQSGSYIQHPGVFNCGFPAHAHESTAEVLVHELSHQNFLLLNSVFPLCQDGSDPLIYSSLKGRERPLSRVLFAYHAAANMALFWSDLAAKSELNDYYLQEQETMSRHVSDLAQALEGAQGMTECGKTFFDTQYALLAERGVLQYA